MQHQEVGQQPAERLLAHKRNRLGKALEHICRNPFGDHRRHKQEQNRDMQRIDTRYPGFEKISVSTRRYLPRKALLIDMRDNKAAQYEE